MRRQVKFKSIKKKLACREKFTKNCWQNQKKYIPSYFQVIVSELKHSYYVYVYDKYFFMINKKNIISDE